MEPVTTDQQSFDDELHPAPAGSEQLSAEQQRQLADAELQATFRREALAQLRRRHCPGCGDDEASFL